MSEYIPIAHIYNGFTAKFGIPRQSGLVNDIISKIVMEKEYRDIHAFRGLEGYSHIWLIWEFSGSVRDGWSPTVLPPRLGGKTRMGVFATRSPFRPNPIGLSLVRLERIDYEDREGPVLYVNGADMLDKTPILDIKPYLPYVESKPDAVGGFAEGVKDYALEVRALPELGPNVPEDTIKQAVALLSQDPRPAYQDDEERVYGMEYAGFDFRFRVKGNVLTIVEIVEMNH